MEMMTVSTRRSRAEFARGLLYNSSLIIGLVVSIGISTSVCNKLMMSVHAEDSKSYIENNTTVVETVGLNEKRTTDVSSVTIETPENASSYEKTIEASEQLKEAADEVTNTDNTVNSGESVVKETGAVVVKVDGQNVYNGMTLEQILDTASSDEEYVWLFLTSPTDIGGAGLTDAGTAAIMGCMQAESGISPNALNGTDGGYGLLQWTDTSDCFRKSNLVNWCSSNGYSYDTLLGQISFASHELETVFSSGNGYSFPVYETLANSNDIDECLRMFFSHAEAGTNVAISQDNVYAGHSTTYDMYLDRLNYAWAIYSEFSS